MKTLRPFASPPDIDLPSLLDAAGAKPTASGDWLLDCGEFSETILIVSLPGADLEALKTEVEKAVAAGTRVVGIWKPGQDGQLPAALADYGAAVISWSADQVRKVICDGAPVWKDPGGGDRPAQKPKRNVC